jgi:hypothetical protein
MVRDRGEPAGFFRLGTPVLALMIRRATTDDLGRLKQLMERP